MAEERTHAWPLCDRGKPFPVPKASKPKTKAKKSRFIPEDEENQRDEERDRDE